MTRRLAIGCGLGSVARVAAAGARVEAVNKDRTGIAINGYDPVAYFTDGRPVRGLSDFAHMWTGAAWRFASAENRDRFAGDPERYAPRFGGYCAWAVSNNYTAPVDPASWRIVDGRLYLNYSRKVQEMWEKERGARIAAAEKNWPGLHR